jgi:hypothetical protein
VFCVFVVMLHCVLRAMILDINRFSARVQDLVRVEEEFSDEG